MSRKDSWHLHGSPTRCYLTRILHLKSMLFQQMEMKCPPLRTPPGTQIATHHVSRENTQKSLSLTAEDQWLHTNSAHAIFRRCLSLPLSRFIHPNYTRMPHPSPHQPQWQLKQMWSTYLLINTFFLGGGIEIKMRFETKPYKCFFTHQTELSGAFWLWHLKCEFISMLCTSCCSAEVVLWFLQSTTSFSQWESMNRGPRGRRGTAFYKQTLVTSHPDRITLQHLFPLREAVSLTVEIKRMLEQ